MPQRQCTATTKAGLRCKAPALPNDDQCFTHSPAVATARAERNRRGGHNKHTMVRATKDWVATGRTISSQELPALLLGMVEAVVDGQLEPARASAVARLVTTALDVAAQVQWEQRLTIMEEMLTRIEQAAPRYTNLQHDRRGD